ncbi:hypothetical protein A1Q1_05917 [Trichosporon asahii var. asahii CBS 2479]|uniref:Protein YAE1 n=1 Tax=Trichosporon asahii var. asahii (strain ATCC 90039 / CBS 2479 / JCM 2466 / KCTC 7840 / NBRC 103889/ NCYC 2677 / UAMH 7654) TaxID=1186058 RepID=J5Q6P5_TRIAS|nr:hypothetical protein A1Q1_05917 [Trichosporon asahii var. asahii CBS 2479]EJT45768.1 hypothetical protein A1Q1_05917 [Trichosporon asahii var. asahii CBS 2479]
MDEDDFFGGPTQGGAQDPLADAEYARIEQKYSDGITDGKMSTLQAGFDQSFATCVPLSRRMGQMRGAANALLSLATQAKADEQLIAELRAVISKLSTVKRDDVLPIDHERIEHEKEHQQDDNGFEFAQTEQRELESLEDMMGNMGQKRAEPAVRGEELLDALEKELTEVQAKLGF